MSEAVYVALGSRRLRAARTITESLAAAGHRVTLVTKNLEKSDGAAGVDRGDGQPAPVTVRRVAGADEARRLLLARNGPLATADLLIAGDPEAMPIALAARRRFRRLRIATDVIPEPARRPAEADVAVLTPWYPSPNDPFAGAFVQATAAAVGDAMGRVAVLHPDNWFYSSKGVAGKAVGVAIERELDRQPGVTVVDTAEGELTRVVVPQQLSDDYVRRARIMADRLRAVLPTGRIEAPLVHAHTGHYAGVIAAAVARPDARIVITEHATFLATIFGKAATRRAYGEALARADAVLCVGRSLLTQIAEQFPEHAGKLRIVPNPIDFDRFAIRPAPPAAPLRWLYIGRMLEHKGVHTLLEAFATVAADDPRVTLTLVGSGQLTEQLAGRIAELGLTGRVTQRPPVRPEEVTALLHEHDLLAHASRSETFGMTIVEAIATQTPVLAARSEGPAETLEGLDHIAGQLFEPTEAPDVIVSAYRKLAAGWDGLDLAAARARLRARFGREAVGDQLREVYREVLAAPPATAAAAPAPDAEAAPAERITVIAIDPPRSRRTRQFVVDARERGYGVDLIAVEAKDWEFDPGVRVLPLGAAERRRVPRRLVDGLLSGGPRRVLGVLRRGTRRLPSPVPEALAITAERGHRKVADRITKRVYGRYYAVVRPRILWRLARREVVPSLDLSRTRRIVVHGLPGVTIGWGLARRNPSISVGTDLTLPDR